MPLTRSADYPVEAAELMAGFAALAHGHDVHHVLEAALQMAINAFGVLGHGHKMSLDELVEVVEETLPGVLDGVRDKRNRTSQPTDIPVTLGRS
ncbi:hypothetical protein [Rhodoplanes roseus]|uniref:Uncharacterized protein n=1 Tax=Rhodoplanes roseus TaxID=29409 RepID=A0A327KXL5_9BRAD|nr:hypothetical protein [Rhodoplanes roseus]RAI42806.1 hypothetical protein CH341_17585 [Rhodoplanes roseus]